MTPADADPADADPAGEARWQRRKRLDEVFGDDLPDTTGDERGPGSGAGRPDDWYERNRPPHHG